MKYTFNARTKIADKKKTAKVTAGGPWNAAVQFAAKLGLGTVLPGNGTEFKTAAGNIVTVSRS
jgi:hypothetical protein